MLEKGLDIPSMPGTFSPRKSLGWEAWRGSETCCCYSVAQSCPTLCNPMDYSVPGSSVLHCTGVYSNLCPLSRWCHPTVSPSATHFSFCLQSSPASGSSSVSWLFTSGGQNIRTIASASVLPMNIQGWFPLGLMGLRPTGAFLKTLAPRLGSGKNYLASCSGLAFSTPASPLAPSGSRLSGAHRSGCPLGSSWKRIWPFPFTCSCVCYRSSSFCYGYIPWLVSKAVLLQVICGPSVSPGNLLEAPAQAMESAASGVWPWTG